MRIVVTGAGGFVGQRLCARLRAEDVEVRGYDREVDVSEASAVAHAVRESRPDAVVHLAAVSFVPDSETQPELAYRVNYIGTRNVLAAVADIAPKARVLVVSSGQVYGSAAPGAPPFDEMSALRPNTHYARTKAAADLLAGVYAEGGLQVVRLRPFNHTGPGRPAHFVESSFSRQIARMERGLQTPRLSVGNLAAVRDFLHVDDVVDAYWRLLQPNAPTGIFNVASGRAVQVQEVLSLLLSHTELRPKICEAREYWRPADASVGTAQRLAKATGWSPTHSLEETLHSVLEAWREITH